jgi:hypothetical protein
MHDIKEMCVTNTQTLYDIIKASFPIVNVKAKAVIGCNIIDADVDDIDQTPILKHTIHLILVADGIYYEPSYELYSVDDIQYYSNIKNLLEGFEGLEAYNIIKSNIKDILPSFLRFVKLEEAINSGEFTITDKDYYNGQLDYIEPRLN